MSHPITFKGRAETTLDVPVVCRAIKPPETASDVQFDHGDLKVTGIELFRSTYGYNHNANAGTKCQKLKVLTRVTTSRAGTVKIKLWKKLGNAAMTSKETVVAAKHDGQGHYKAEYTEIITVNEPTYVQLKAEELVSQIGKSTAWKSINLQCTSSGGGGFTVGTSEPTAPPLQVTPQVSLNDLTGKTSCPREGRAVIAIKTNKPDALPYLFRCSPGGSVDGVANTAPHSEGGWIAPAIAKFTIDRTGMYRCRLHVRDKTATKTIAVAVAERHFTCANRVVEPHPGGLTGVTPTGHSGAGGTKITNPQRCRIEWQTSCNRTPVRECSKTVQTTCRQVPKMECRNVRTRTCNVVPKVDCRMTQTRSCKRVPKVECREVRGKRICARTMTTLCRPQHERVCSRKMERKCTLGTKRECKHTIGRQCSQTPTTNCGTSWRNTCTRKQVRVCG